MMPLANASGAALYQRECAPCHGPAGHGDGPEAPTFRNTPRDFGDLARAEPSARIVERVRRSRLRMLEVDEDVVVERRKRMVEELVGHLQRMPDVPWPQVRRGAEVYAERCENCHGPNGRPVSVNVLQRGPQATGRQPAPDFQKARGDAELLAVAQGQGHPAMPGFTPLTNEDEARALLAYLRVLSNGFAWYSLWCAGCHGDEGRGDGPLATGIDKPTVAFDRAYLSAQSPADLRRKAMHVFNDIEPATPHFQRNLSEGQARAVLMAVRMLQTADSGTTTAVAVAAAAGATPGASVTPAAAASAGAEAMQMPAAVATMLGAGAPAPTPAPPTLAGMLARHAASTPSAMTASPPATAPVTGPPSSATASAAAVPASSATPVPSVSRTPAPSRTPAAKTLKTAKPATAATKKAAKKPVKPKATPKPKVKAKPKAKPTPAKKAAAPRPVATPEPVLAP